MKNPIKKIGLLSAFIFLHPFSQTYAQLDIKTLPSVTIVEAEDMTLSSAKIMQEKDASGGKAIKMLDAKASASKELKLPKGQYVVNVVLKAQDFEHDGFYLSADDKVKRTASGHFHKAWVYGQKFLIFKSDGKTPVTLRATSTWKDRELKEADMLIDRLELAPFESSADVLDHWTGSN